MTEKNRKEQIRSQVNEFHKEYPEVWDLFCHYTNDRINRGFKNYSADAIMHRVRWETSLKSPANDGFKINNNFVTFYARRFAKEHPEHYDFFRFREQTSENKTVTSTG